MSSASLLPFTGERESKSKACSVIHVSVVYVCALVCIQQHVSFHESGATVIFAHQSSVSLTFPVSLATSQHQSAAMMDPPLTHSPFTLFV